MLSDKEAKAVAQSTKLITTIRQKLEGKKFRDNQGDYLGLPARDADYYLTRVNQTTASYLNELEAELNTNPEETLKTLRGLNNVYAYFLKIHAQLE